MNREQLDHLLVPRSAPIEKRAAFFYRFMGKTAQYEGDGISDITRKRLVTDELVDDKSDVALQNAAQMIAMQEAEVEQHRQQLAAVSQNSQQTQQQAAQMIQQLQQQVQQLGQQAQATQQVMEQARQMQAQMGSQVGEATQAALQAGQAATAAEMDSFRAKQDLTQFQQDVQGYKEMLRQAIENDPIQRRLQMQAMQQQQIAMASQQAQMAVGQQGQPQGQPGQPQQEPQQPQQGAQPGMAEAGKMAALRQMQLHDRDIVLKMAAGIPGPEATMAIGKGVAKRVAMMAGRHKGWAAAGLLAGGFGALALHHHLKNRKAKGEGARDPLPPAVAPIRNATFKKPTRSHALPARNAPSMAAINA